MTERKKIGMVNLFTRLRRFGKTLAQIEEKNLVTNVNFNLKKYIDYSILNKSSSTSFK